MAKARTTASQTMPIQEIVEAVLDFKAANRRLPSLDDAFPGTAFTTWRDVDAELQRTGRGRLAFVFDVLRWRSTPSLRSTDIASAIAAHQTKHGTWPRSGPEKAYVHDGMRLSWQDVDNALRRGRSDLGYQTSLSEFKQVRGFTERSVSAAALIQFLESIAAVVPRLSQVQRYYLLSAVGGAEFDDGMRKELIETGNVGGVIAKLVERQEPRAESGKTAGIEEADCGALVEPGAASIEEPASDWADDASSVTAESVEGVVTASGDACLKVADEDAAASIVQEAVAEATQLIVSDWSQETALRTMRPKNAYDASIRTATLEAIDTARARWHGSDAKRAFAYGVDLNLMQMVINSMLVDQRQVMNLSDPGAGKTIQAITGARLVGARCTVVIADNNTKQGWVQAVSRAYPDTLVFCDAVPAHRPSGWTVVVVNYEKFQTPTWRRWVERVVGIRPDMLVFDEIHRVKQRASAESIRRAALKSLRESCATANPGLYVLGMTGTAAITSLREPASLLELVRGRPSEVALGRRSTVANALELRAELFKHGHRLAVKPSARLVVKTVDAVLPDAAMKRLARLAKKRVASVVPYETEMTKARAPYVVASLKPGTVVYTHAIDAANGDSIAKMLVAAIRKAGYSVATYTGSDKSGVEAFKTRRVDVLVASSAVGTGVDGLQHVADRMIFNVLPWTAAAYDQTVGRLWRQGQTSRTVEVIHVVASGTNPKNGHSWSFDAARVERIRSRRTVADVVLDGKIPKRLESSDDVVQRVIAAKLAALRGGER